MIESVYSERILEQHVSVIYHTCRKHTRSEEAAWDACQETFLAFSKRRDSLDLTEDLSPWLRETARRCSLAVSRKERREETNCEQLEVQTEVDHVDVAFLTEATSILREEAAKMSAADQKILRLVYVDCVTHRAAAEELGCPAGSVHAKAEKARNRLRRRLERRGIATGLLLFLFLLNGETEAAWNPVRTYPKLKPAISGRHSKVALLSFLYVIALYLFASNGLISEGVSQVFASVGGGTSESCGCEEEDLQEDSEESLNITGDTEKAVAVSKLSRSELPNG